MATPIVPDERPPAKINGKANPAYAAWCRERFYSAHPGYRRKMQVRYKATRSAYERRHRAKTNARRRQRYREDPAYRARTLAQSAQTRTPYSALSEGVKERRRQSVKAWATRNSEKRSAAYKVWHAENRRKKRLYSQLYDRQHRIAINARQRQARRKNPELYNSYAKKRRALRSGAPINDLTAAQWKDIKEAYKHCCVYCGRKMKRLTQDHITPLSKGGSHTVSNVVPACNSCNCRKKDGAVLCPIQPLLLTIV